MTRNGNFCPLTHAQTYAAATSWIRRIKWNRDLEWRVSLASTTTVRAAPSTKLRPVSKIYFWSWKCEGLSPHQLLIRSAATRLKYNAALHGTMQQRLSLRDEDSYGQEQAKEIQYVLRIPDGLALLLVSSGPTELYVILGCALSNY